MPAAEDSALSAEIHDTYPALLDEEEALPLFATRPWMASMGGRIPGDPFWATARGQDGAFAAAHATLVRDPDAYPFFNAPKLLLSPSSPFADSKPEVSTALAAIGADAALGAPHVSVTYPGYACHLVGPAARRAEVARRVVALLVEEGRRRGAQLCAFLYVDARDRVLREALAESGAVGLPLTADAELPVPAGGFEEYLAGFKAKRRTTLRRDRAVVRERGLRVVERGLDDGATLDRLAALRARHRTRYDLPSDHERERAALGAVADALGPRSTVLAAVDDTDRIVTFTLFVRDGSLWHALYTGTDDADQRSDRAHFEVTYYAAIEAAQRHGVRRISFGLAADRAKALRGCRLVPVEAWVRSLDPRWEPVVADAAAAWRSAVTEEGVA